MKKRVLIWFGLLVLILLSLFGYAYYIEPNQLTIKTVEIETTQPIEPSTIVFFTDTHFGELYDEDHAKKIVENINEMEPDIVIFGGDLFDNYARDRELIDFDALREELLGIHALAGKYAVKGNHDYGGGAVRIYEEFLASCGFEVLANEQVTLKDYGITLIGFDDLLMSVQEPSLYEVESETYQIMIAHEPITSQYIKSKTETLLLSGHTHGGQITIPFLTDQFLPVGSGEYVKGHYTKKDLHTEANLQMYTSSGIGMTKIPLRFFNPPELIELKLQQK